MTRKKLPEAVSEVITRFDRFKTKGVKAIEQSLNRPLKAAGFTWEEENPLPSIAREIREILDEFSGKGTIEIKDELDRYTEDEIDILGKKVERLLSV
ncbi:hypothetical protein AGMMS49991_02640 [Spirochaetia bacterium]|nr:hypothetical protein AGMMS49991_02640 [Spirochaetia bacterium]